jgi:hypothetical protein
MKPKAFICGEISNFESFNFDRYYDIEFNVKREGFTIISPADLLMQYLRSRENDKNKLIDPENYIDIKVRVMIANITMNEFIEYCFEQLKKVDCLVLFDKYESNENSMRIYNYFQCLQKPIFKYAEDKRKKFRLEEI